MLSTLINNDVRQTLDHFRRSVDEMFENFSGYQQPQSAPAGKDSAWTFSPILESAWNDQSLLLRAIVPGVAEPDVRVTVQHNQLVIEGERKMPEGFANNAFRQLAYGRFYTAVTLPTGLDVDHLVCWLHDGVLDIKVPILEASKPKQIQIQTGNDRKTLNA